MTTFDQAREIVREALSHEYPPIAGLHVEESGLENADSYQLFTTVTSPEYLIAEDGPAHIVDKATGAYTKKWGFQVVIPDAVPCGAPDPDDEL